MHAGKAWYHITFNTYATWLPGDPRGFRNRNHRKHSQGDYQSPPPVGEHAGLLKLARSKAKSKIIIPDHQFTKIGLAIIEKARQQDNQLLVLAVDAHHVHVLAELSEDRDQAKKAVGLWKQKASHTIRDVIQGQVWSKGCHLKRIVDREHHLKTFRYIEKHEDQQAWVWRFDQG